MQRKMINIHIKTHKQLDKLRVHKRETYDDILNRIISSSQFIFTQNVLDRIEESRKEFEETIGGKKWSMNDTLREWIKILDGLKPHDNI